MADCDIDPSVDHYAALALPSTATSAQIKTAWKKLALLHHPDKNQGSNASIDAATKRFQQIQTAYNLLSDDDNRRRYDFARANKPLGGSANLNPTGAYPSAAAAGGSTRYAAPPPPFGNSYGPSGAYPGSQYFYEEVVEPSRPFDHRGRFYDESNEDERYKGFDDYEPAPRSTRAKTSTPRKPENHSRPMPKRQTERNRNGREKEREREQQRSRSYKYAQVESESESGSESEGENRSPPAPRQLTREEIEKLRKYQHIFQQRKEYEARREGMRRKVFEDDDVIDYRSMKAKMAMEEQLNSAAKYRASAESDRPSMSQHSSKKDPPISFRRQNHRGMAEVVTEARRSRAQRTGSPRRSAPRKASVAEADEDEDDYRPHGPTRRPSFPTSNSAPSAAAGRTPVARSTTAEPESRSRGAPAPGLRRSGTDPLHTMVNQASRLRKESHPPSSSRGPRVETQDSGYSSSNSAAENLASPTTAREPKATATYVYTSRVSGSPERLREYNDNDDGIPTPRRTYPSVQRSASDRPSLPRTGSRSHYLSSKSPRPASNSFVEDDVPSSRRPSLPRESSSRSNVKATSGSGTSTPKPRLFGEVPDRTRGKDLAGELRASNPLQRANRESRRRAGVAY